MRWKWFALLGAALIIALAIAAYLVLSSYDYNKLKPRIAREVAEATGRELTLSGDVGLDLGLSPALVITDVALANAPWASDPQMITARRIEAKVRLLPLLIGDLELKYLTLAGVDVKLEIDKAGRRNWEFTTNSPETATLKIRRIAVKAVRIENLKFTYRDEKAARTTQFNLAGLEMRRQADHDFLALKLQASYNMQPVTLSGRIGSIQKIVSGRQFPLELEGRFSSATTKIEGSIGEIRTLKGIDLNIEVSGKNLEELGRSFGIGLPRTDDFDFSGRLTGPGQSPSLENISGRVSAGGCELVVSGRIGNLIALQDLGLQLKASGKDLAQTGTIVGQKLPATDGFEVQGHLTGSARALSLADILSRAHRENLRLEVTGEIRNLLAFEGMDLRLKGAGKNLAPLEDIVGLKLPPTDAFTLQGRLTGSAKALSLQNIQSQTRRDSLSLNVTGEIKNLLAFEGMDLRLNGAGRDIAQLEDIVGLKLPQTDAFALQGRLKGSAKALSLQNIQGQTRRDSLSLNVTGEINNLLALEGADLRLKASGKELAEIGPLIGTTLPELGPFDLSGHLRGSAKSFSLGSLTAVVDQSDFNGQAKVEIGKRPKLTLVLNSSLLDMTALLKSLEQEEKEPSREPDRREQRIFRNDPLPFDVLKQVDADIRLNAKNIRARDASFEFGRLKLTLENGDLSVDSLQATYKQTRISGNFHLLPGSPPRIAAKFLVQDFDLGGLLKELRVSEEVRSHLDIAIDVNSSGNTIQGLMTGLNGSVGAVMGKGHLTRYLDLLSVGLSRKVFQFWGHHPKGDEIRCAVVQFDINKGIATSRAFVFDSEAGVLTGEGDINLGTEQVNFLLVPEPRYPTLTNFWTKLRVSGTILDPKVRPDTVSLLTKGAKALGALVLGPLGLLAPFVSLGANKAHPCNVDSIGK